MPSDVLITPASSKIEFTDGANATKTLKITGTSLNTDTSFAIGATTANNTLSVLGSASIGSSYNVAGPTNGLIVQGNVGIGTTSPSNTKLHIIGDWVSGHSTVKVQGITDNTTGYGFYDTAGSRLGYLAYTGAAFEWYNNANVPVIFYSNTLERMRIAADGKVGIGTTSPASKLEVKGVDDATITAIFQSTAGGNAAYNGGIQLGNAASSQNSQIYHDSSGDNTLTFKSNYASGTGNKFVFAPGGTERVRFQQNGNVGLGITSPNASLHIKPTTLGANGFILERYASTAKLVYAYESAADGYLEVRSGADVIVSKISGYVSTPTYFQSSVGVGTASPSNKVTIEADATGASFADNSVGQLVIRGATNTAKRLGLGIDTTNNVGVIQAQLYGTGQYPLVLNPAGGNVGIGATVASAKLHVAGTTGLYQSAGSTYLYYDHSGVNTWRTGIFTDNTSSYIIGHDSGGTFATKILTITMGGNVGINTITPTYKLEVIGDARISGGIINPSLSAQWTLSGGGTVTYNGSAILWSNRVIAIPVEKDELSTTGYIDINCPTSGTITYYNASNVTTTATCAASGVPISAWEALYYEITPGQTQASDQTKFRLVNYQNSTWRPSSNWLLICAVNGDASSLKWIPGQVIIPTNGSFDSSNSTNNWQIAGTTNYVAKFTSANKVGSSIIYDTGSSIGIGVTSPADKLQVGSGHISIDAGYRYYMDANVGAVSIRKSGTSMVFNVGSNDRVYIDSNGNVGAGISTLIHKIQASGLISAGDPVYNNDSTFIGAILNNDGTNPGLDLRRWNGGAAGTNNHGATYIATNITGDTLFYNGLIAANTRATSLKMIINVSGNVGIGTSNPLNKFAVISSNSYGYYNRTEPVAVFQGSSPSTVLIAADANSNGAYSELKLGNAQSTYYTYSAYIRGIQGAGIDYYRLEFGTANGSAATTKMTIATDGNVGIGTISPSTKLHVVGNADIGDSGADTGVIIRHGAGSSQYGRLRFYDSNGTNINTIHSFPTAWNGGTLLNSSAGAMNLTGTNGVTFGSWNNVDVAFASGGTNYFKGNVGIGINTPSTVLNIRASAPTSTGTVTTGTNLLIDSNTSNYITFRNTADNGTYAGLTFLDNNTGGYIVFRNYTGDVVGGSDSMIYGTYQDHIFQNGSTEAINSKTETMRIKGNGNVGIGTSSPLSLLHVSKVGNSSGGTILMGLANDGAAKWSYLVSTQYNSSSNAKGFSLIGGYTDASSNVVAIGGSIYEANPATELQFYTHTAVTHATGGTRRMTINTNGNVGIGYTNPAYLLDVNGVARINGNFNITGGGDLGIFDSDGTGAFYSFMDAGVGYIRIDDGGTANGKLDINSSLLYIQQSGGNVGVGTNNPTSKLHVWNGTVRVSGFQSIAAGPLTFLRSDYNGSAAVQINFLNINPSNGYDSDLGIQLMNTAGSMVDVMRVKGSTGNVGIGVINPLAQLHINEATSGAAALRVDGTNGTLFSVVDDLSDSLMSVNNSAGLPVLEVFADDRVVMGQYGQNDLVVRNNKVGVGTVNPATKLDVFGPISIRGTKVLSTGFDDFGGLAYDIYANIRVLRSTSAQGDGMYIGYGGSGGPLRFFSNSGATEFMTIATSGNIGVNSTSPNAKLHIIGATNTDSGLIGGTVHVRDSTASASPATAGMSGVVFSSSPGTDWAIGKWWSGTASRFVIKDATSALGTNVLVIDPNGNVGIGFNFPQRQLEVLSANNNYVSVGVRGLGVGSWCGIHFGYREDNNNYRKSAIVFERTDLTSTDAQGKIHILNGPQGSSGNATLSDAKLTINEYGNVGIGTTTVYTRTHVYGTLTVDAAGATVNSFTEGIRLGAASNGYSIVTFGVNAGASSGQITNQWWIGKHGGDNSFNFNSQGGGDVFRILQGGNVGIGNTTPGYKLHVNGNGYFNSTLQVNSNITLSGGGDVIINDSDGTGSFNSFMDSGVAYIRIDDGGTANGTLNINSGTLFVGASSGNVGVGTITPSARLQVGTNSTAASNDNSPIARFGGSGSGSRVYGLTLANTAGAAVSNDSSLSFIVAGNYSATGIISAVLRNTSIAATDLVFTNYNNALFERMRIQYDGNVGIGTSLPATLLQIGSGTPTSATGGLQFGDDTGTRLYRSSSGIVTCSGSIEISANASLNGNYGTWTGEINKIQWHSNNLYFVNRGGGSWLFRNSGGSNVFSVDANGGTSVSGYLSAATYVYATTYLQTNGNLIYPSGYGATLKLEVGNPSSNAWIDGLTLAPGGNVVIAGTLTESSSIRYKENIETISAPILPKLNKIRPVTYNKKDNPKHIEYGIIAEELNELFPEFVNKNDKGEVESVNYSRLTVILIKAVKELQEEVEKLKNK